MRERPLPSVLQAPLWALALLTRLPVPRELAPTTATQGRAVVWYPLVGLLLGLILWVSQWLLTEWVAVDERLAALLLLALWVALTGALHLDGLADAVDGYFAGHKIPDPAERRVRVLAVMRDPGTGALAVVALVLVLLGQWLALTLLLEAEGLVLAGWLLLLALPRTALLPYLMSTGYARTEGLAGELKAALPTRSLVAASAALALATPLLWPPLLALSALALLALLIMGWRALWVRQIGGFTGDCLGALVVLAELMLLMLLATGSGSL